MTTSHPSWVIAAAAAGGMPAEACPEIEAAVESYHRDDEADFEIAGPTTKEAIADAIETAAQLSEKLAWLEGSSNYQKFDTNGEPVSIVLLTEARRIVDQLSPRLAADRARFRKKSYRDRDRLRIERLIKRLLDIRNNHLGTGYPVVATDTPASGPFIKYLEMCLKHSAGAGSFAVGLRLKKMTREFARAPKKQRRS